MFQESEGESLFAGDSFKCARCCKHLDQPVQLPGCLHILCSSCFKELDSSQSPNLICPKCDQQNARHNILRSISGVDNTSHSYSPCDYCGKPPFWSCFICAKYFCISCRPNHDNSNKEHQLFLIPHHTVELSKKIFDSDSHQACLVSGLPAPIIETEAIDGGGISKITCPICQTGNCAHCEFLEKSKKQLESQVGICNIQGHGLQELKFFCLECWKPVCGDCSQRGEHKKHDTEDLFAMREYLIKALRTSQDTLTMFAKRLEFDIEEEIVVEQSLKKHIEEADCEIKNRKCKVIEDATDAFNDILKQIELQGKDILHAYKGKLFETENCRRFIDSLQKAIKSLTVDKNLNIAQYNHAFRCQQVINEIVDKMKTRISDLQKSQERRVVLPEIVSTPILSLARAGTEWKHLKLAFKFPIENVLSVHSIVVLGSEQCLLSCELINTNQDAIHYYNYDAKTKRIKQHPYDVDKGRYLIAQTSNGEIVASYSNKAGKEHFVKYNDGNFLDYRGLNSYIKFTDISQVDYPAFGIATTSDDKILLCYQVAEKKNVNGILKLSLQGKVLSDSWKMPDSNLICPNYVAVNDKGEIAASDKLGSSVVLLDKDLNISERINFRFPSSFHEDQRDLMSSVFKPYGLCYDSYGRIIVTDPDNNSVVRLSRDYYTRNYTMEPLLVKTAEEPYFTNPQLVAMGKDSRLWVVCKEYVFVYDYCT